MRKSILFFTCLLFIGSLFSQHSQLAQQAAEWAEIDYTQGNTQSSIDNYLKAIDYENGTVSPDSSFIGVCNYYIGFLYSQEGNIKYANTYYQIAADITLKINNKEAQGVIFRSLGKLYLNTDYTEALKYYQKAYELAIELQNISEQEVCLSDMGLIYYYTGKHTEALENFNRALELTKQLENKPEEPLAIINNIGLVYNAAGDYQMALNYFNEAVDLHDSLNLSTSLIMQLINIATCYNYLGDQEKSIDYYKKAIEDAKVREDKTEEAMILGVFGNAYYQWGLYDLAIESHNESLLIYEKINMPVGIARSKSNMAMIYLIKSNYAAASKYYKEALEITKELGDNYGTATILNSQGEGNRNLGYNEKAKDKFNESLEISLDAGLKEPEAISLNGIGLIYFTSGSYQLSIEYFKKAIEIFYYFGNNDHISTALNNIGMAYQNLGQYDKAVLKLEEAYNFSLITGNLYNQALSQNNIGLTYYYWSKYDDALNYFKQTLVFSKKNDIKKIEATVLNNIGLLYYAWGKFDEADLHYKKAYDICLETQDKATMALVLNNVGIISFEENLLVEALHFFNRSLQLHEELRSETSQPLIYLNIGQIYYQKDSYDTALIYFNKSLQIAQKANDIPSEANILNMIGNLYYYLGNNKEAIQSYEESLAIKERLRKTAPGNIKRDYLAENLHVYNNLISTYIDLGDNNAAFRTNEQSKARYLMEQLSTDDTAVRSFAGFEDYYFLKNSVLLSFANTNYYNKVVFTLNGNDTSINAIKISDTNFFNNDFTNTRFDDQLACIQKRGVTVLKKEKNRELIKELVEDENFDEIINYYRLLLADPNASNSDLAKEIGKSLYKYLIKPIEAHLQGSEKLVIVPEGPLSNIPFECLIDEDGHYLTEKYTIQYTPSLNVLYYLENRKYNSSHIKILALGNPNYDVSYSKNDTINTEQELMAFRRQLDYSIKKDEKLGQFYGNLGYGYWTSLDGTEKEINEIANTFKNTVILGGNSASEKSIRELSNSGELKDYNIIHFATHGITIPQAPELSALVLTQVETDTVDDGYLRMGEISNLKMQADFVNLSGCETGLGKIYGGEGVVGLTQAFLIAGANGLSVSLWQVSDESTALFMTELYKLVESSNMSYLKAMTEIKRRFIHGEYGDKYTQPFYWGPFVYYGKD